MGIKDTITKGTKEAIIKAGVQILEKDPENNVDKIFSIIRKGVRDEFSKEGIDEVERYYNEMPVVHDLKLQIKIV